VGGMESELVPTEPSQTYPTATVVISLYTQKEATKSLISRLLFIFLQSVRLLTWYDSTHRASVSASTAVDAYAWIDLVDITF